MRLQPVKELSPARVGRLLRRLRQIRVLVVGDAMLDQYLWGQVARISPEAPVPVVEFKDESFMPGGAANVARNLTALGASAELFSVIGRDNHGQALRRLLADERVGCQGLLEIGDRPTSVKTRIIAHQQQIVRIDRETRTDLEEPAAGRLLASIQRRLARADAVIVGDYGKGVVTQVLLDRLRPWCGRRGIWLSLDPKPVHHLNLAGLSLITPNRKEAFELAGLPEPPHRRAGDPSTDPDLLRVSRALHERLKPALLLITLGDQGMLLCQRQAPPYHIPTVAREVFDVSGAGDTVIASFTLAIAAGASPVEAAIFSNHAAGVVVGQVGTATVSSEALRANFRNRS